MSVDARNEKQKFADGSFEYKTNEKHYQNTYQPPPKQQPQQQFTPKQMTDMSLNSNGMGPYGGGVGDDPKPFTPSDDPNLKDGHVEVVNFCQLLKQNWLDVFTYCMVFGSFGMGVACLGPTLLDLGCQTATDLREMSWVFFVQLLMTSIGTIVAGFLANRCAVSFLLFLSMIGMPLTMFIIPSCTGLTSLVLVVMVMGLCMGCIDCISNLGMINLFKKNVSPFLQAMHFSYGMGAFLSPMVAEPFLLNVDCSPLIDGYLMHKVNSTSNNMTAVTVPPSPDQLLILQRESRLKNAFYIIGTIQLPVTILVAFVVFKKSLQMTGNFIERASAYIKESRLEEVTKVEGKTFAARCFTCGTNQTILLTLLAAGAMFLFDGLQSSYGGYVYSYSVKSVTGLKQSEGAVLNACFWGTFALGRLIAIVLASRLTAAFMLLVNIVGACVSITLTIILGNNHVGIYFGSCFLGLFLSSASPTVLSLTEQFVNINSSITSTLVVFAGIGETLCPVIIGNLFVTVGPSSFLVFCFSLIFISLLVYVALWLLGRETEKYTAMKKESFIWLPGVWKRRAKDSGLITKSTVKYYSRMQDSPSLDGGGGGTMELKSMDSTDIDDNYQRK